ncbi:sporulation protein RMD1-like [Chenopodium quinoa]|nr:sporulation protein RMD1-like [Chenopodium quinoa]
MEKLWRPATRSLDTHLKSIFLSPPKPSPSAIFAAASSSSTRTLTTFSSLSLFLSPPSNFSPSKTLIPPKPSSSLLLFCWDFRCYSSVSPLDTNKFEWNEPISCSEVGDAVSFDDTDDNGDVDTRPAIPVRAFFFSTSVDLKSLVELNKHNFIPPSSRMTNYVVLKFGNLKPEPNGVGATLSGSDCGYMVVFQYGSIVLFNVRDHEVDGYLKIVERHASGLLPEMRKDEYEVREKPTLSTWMQAGLDRIMLQYLNIDGIRTIGSVLGQSIALDYYVRQVDGMVAEFTDINRAMEKTGTFTMERKKLFQLVGKANSNLADVILKLGLFERSDIAWKDAKYAQIWEYLRDEFELTQRFASLDFKLKFVEHNIRFLQEILQNRKSDFLEWLIIILIGAEILISVYDIAHKSL